MSEESGACGANRETDSAEGVNPIEQMAVAVLKTVYDPEIPVNIYDLGLIYSVDVSTPGEVHVTMTLTSPGCPEAQTLPLAIEERLEEIPGITKANVEVVWEPPWTPDRMTEEARLELGFL